MRRQPHPGGGRPQGTRRRDSKFRRLLGGLDEEFARDQYALYFFARRFRSIHDVCRQVAEAVESGLLVTPEDAARLVQLAADEDWLLGVGDASKARPGQRGRNIGWATQTNSRDGDPGEAVTLLDEYCGQERWVLELQVKRRSDPTWQPSPRIAGIVVAQLSPSSTQPAVA